MKKAMMALLCGGIFGAGLALSGMTNTEKVLGFLDLFGHWDYDLMLVMGGAVAVTLLLFRPVLKAKAPVFADRFFLPEQSLVTRRLLVGAALFGLGWGLYGYCPGPAVVAMGYLHQDAILFVIAMAAGMFLANTRMFQKI
ncbi:YeeE/YedE family protein [Aestuariirhabdus sp. Z084]|uniref:DUF6691 family protein n=1 Tax=Aestuariirhabdus haliotis TaxID=2918751 RepID=UPI00201B44C7|nr:DUF6691 family protein [Aestuariirhabdus haliotis]MCL6416408.1 YeeE/YedE family protein [Aestuariirhabdus haliotis]MCL6420426.1 YeeE/YedE family protein [Aestuariirhabdus haliotis]